MIGVIDYSAGNITSVSNALDAAGADFTVSSSREVLERADGLILPGVGGAPGAMESLHEENLASFLSGPTVPLLGICLGMQLLFESSEEGDTPCLSLLPGRVVRLDDSAAKVPHMGWNEVDFIPGNPLFEGIPPHSCFYFAHSFIAAGDACVLGTTDCGRRFPSAVARGSVFGVQFHPEKSGSNGLRILKNFAGLCRSSRP